MGNPSKAGSDKPNETIAHPVSDGGGGLSGGNSLLAHDCGLFAGSWWIQELCKHIRPFDLDGLYL